MIYLDHNATTPIDERVLDAMQPYLKTFYGNASSLYRQGRFVKSAIDSARDQVAALVGVNPDQVIFTSGGTEANNLALAAVGPRAELAISAIEHPSVFEPAEHLKNQGHKLTVIGVDCNGLIDRGHFNNVIENRPGLISIMLANNEIGVIQDIARCAGMARDRNILFHTDAVQAIGKIPVDFKQLGVQLMSLSAHKIYGPKGCGALIYDRRIKINPLLRGGGQEYGLRAGTENTAAIVGFGKAAELAGKELAERSNKMLVLRKQLEAGLKSISGTVIFAEHTERLVNTVQMGFPNRDGEMLVMKLDQKGIAVSSGSACSSGGKEPSPVLTAMGVEADLAKSALRISLGIHNTENEISTFITQLKALVH
ncbi:MAG: cysteine desulfurase family protein [Gammaproteobacteria bacterium]